MRGKTERRRRVAALVLSTVVGVTVLSATSPARAACSPDSAARSYADAHRAFEEKRFDDSVDLLRRAYECDPNPVYLGNIARTYEEAGRPKDALEAWRAYLAKVTDERERKTTEGRISALTKMLDDLERLEREKEAAEVAKRKAEEEARAHPPAPPSPSTPPPAPPPRRHVPAPAWILTAAGGAGLAGGVVLGLFATSAHSSATRATTVDEAESKQNDARALAHAANWSFGIGGAVAAVGLTWMGITLLGSPASDKPAPSVAVGVIGTRIGIVGSFQ